VVITGGNGFLGSQFGGFLAKGGVKIVVFDRTGKEPVDITSPGDVKEAVARTIKKFGKIDVLIHAAAMDSVPGSPQSASQFLPYEKYPLDIWEKEMKVNLTGAQVVTQEVAPYMMEKKSGSIIFIASDLALIAPQNKIYGPGRFKDIAYTTSKAGMLGLMRTWASYLGSYNVRVNAIAPGGMYHGQPEEFVKKNSELNMLGRMAREDEYNGPIAYLASDASSYMTGACMSVDGGRTAW